jgi:integrase
VKKVARAYSAAEIRKLIVASPEHERLLWHFFIGTGAREKEVATACWRDIDFGRQTFKVHLFAFCASQPLSRALLMEYRTTMDHLSPSTINVRLSAIRKLVGEARRNGMIGLEEATKSHGRSQRPAEGSSAG